MRILVLFAAFLLVPGFAGANNIQVNGEARVVDFVGPGRDTAIVEFGISWENSWRDDFNWDAAWIFLKYKKRGLISEWHHAYLCREGHEVQPQGGDTGSYTFMFGEVGEGSAAEVTGLFLMRDGLSEGNVNTRVRVKWPLQGNSRLPLTEGDFGENRDSIFVAAYAVEMVYVPLGSYYLGDREMTGAFYKNPAGPIPASKDIVDNNSGYTITAKHAIYPAYLAADRVNNPNYSSTYTWYTYTTEPSWWKIDFKTPRIVRYFGISGCVTYPVHRPGGTWYLEGSDNDTDWTPLWEGPPEEWVANATSYPVQHSIRVTNPGLYRYYRINIPNNSYAMAQNIAMTESDLYADGYELCIDSEEALDLGTYFLADDGQPWTGSLPASYPKGYRGYYCMKYEVSQEQYVEFLNSLTLAQQKNRVANNDFNNMVKGDYVFGDLKHPNCRNGIAFIMTKGAGTPAVFGNNLNPGNKFYSEDDGQTLACNYLSPADMLAYCDWSGLRPMSELEYEKACRRPYPQLPDKGELAWNTGGGIHKIRTENDLTGTYTERETPFDYRVNVNSGGRINGPVRSGAFATSRTGQVEAGATYWGLMEMSGNVWEMCYSANAAGRSFVGDNAGSSHGDGYLNSDGTTDIGASYWPNVVGAVAVRGGSFAGADSLLRTSDRTYATGNYFSEMTYRDSTVGFRCARSVLNTSGFTAGQIYAENGTETDTVCNTTECVIQGSMPENPVGKVTYSWYKSEDEGVSWELIAGETGMNLVNYAIRITNGRENMWIKRKAVCAVGESETSPVKLHVEDPVFTINTDTVVFLRCANQAFEALPVMNNGSFTWLYEGDTIKGELSGTGNRTYKPARTDFPEVSQRGGQVKITCIHDLPHCSSRKRLVVVIPSESSVCPSRVEYSGVVYPAALFGCQCWLTQNLDVGTFSTYTDNYATPGIQKMCYGNVEQNCIGNGGLYCWESAVYGENTGSYKYAADGSGYIQGICPDGWHVPSHEEWYELEKVQEKWNAQLAGFRNNDKVSYSGYNTAGWWWTSSQASVSGGARFRYINSTDEGTVFEIGSYTYAAKAYGMSVRCILN